MRSPLNWSVSRRSMLGAMGASFLGFSVRDLLAYAGTSHQAQAEQVILFWNGGGMSHIDTWDPKPGAATGGEFEAIETSADGVRISEIFPELAQQMHHCALVRSIAGTQGAHERATYHLQTSYNMSANIIHPGFGSVVVHELQQQGDLPPYVTISGRAPRASYLGQTCEAYFVGAPGEKDPYLAFPDGIAQLRGDQRLATLNKFNSRFSAGKSDNRLASTQTSIEDAVRLMKSPALSAFDLSKVPTKTINRYGDTDFGKGCLLAKQLIDTGVRFVQVNRGGFDTHMNNFPAMRGHGEIMDPAMASLIQDLADSGKLEKTLIVMLSEFGRTPTINKDKGRDHYPQVFSGFLAGGGIKGGTVIGSSDDEGREVKDRPVKVADLHATFCHALGINPSIEVMTPLQRPMKLVDGGEVVTELFA